MKKNKFEVGDIIKGTNNRYVWTNKQMTKARVTKTGLKGGEMKIEILEHENASEIGEVFSVENNTKEFELITLANFTKADLEDGDIVTLRNGEKLMFYEEDLFDIGRNHSNCLYDLDELTDDLKSEDEEDEDIVKVERAIDYTTLYQRKEAKEMTVEEISKALGYEVKIVKGDK